MTFYAASFTALHEADAPPLMNPAYWAWITARSSDERLLYLTSRGDTDALKKVLLQIERGGVREEDLPFDRGDTPQQIVRAQARPLDLAFLTWAFRFSSLERLHLSGTGVEDLTPLAGLTRLKLLDISGLPELDDLTPLAGLHNLRQLHCYHTKVQDLTPLRGLLRLKELAAGRTGVSDLTPLAGLSRLLLLGLAHTEVSDLTPLAGLRSLETLDLESTKVQDLTPLAGLRSLDSLDLTSTKVQDLTPLQGLLALEGLVIRDTDIPSEQVRALQAALPDCYIYRRRAEF